VGLARSPELGWLEERTVGPTSKEMGQESVSRRVRMTLLRIGMLTGLLLSNSILVIVRSVRGLTKGIVPGRCSVFSRQQTRVRTHRNLEGDLQYTAPWA
jgi:hypothetical protein